MKGGPPSRSDRNMVVLVLAIFLVSLTVLGSCVLLRRGMKRNETKETTEKMEISCPCGITMGRLQMKI